MSKILDLTVNIRHIQSRQEDVKRHHEGAIKKIQSAEELAGQGK